MPLPDLNIAVSFELPEQGGRLTWPRGLLRCSAGRRMSSAVHRRKRGLVQRG
jgi:hypothetical protein